MKDGSFLQAMEGCDTVHHIASPFLSPSQIKDWLRECVEPALREMRNVLESVNQCQTVRQAMAISNGIWLGLWVVGLTGLAGFVDNSTDSYRSSPHKASGSLLCLSFHYDTPYQFSANKIICYRAEHINKSIFAPRVHPSHNPQLV